MKRSILSIAFFCASFTLLKAQTSESPVKGTLIGFSFNFSDFTTPNEIKATSLSDVLKNGHYSSIQRMDPGFSLMYWRGISKTIDFSARYNGSFSQYSKDANFGGNGYINELEGSLHFRPISDNHFFSPFLSAGFGGGTYNSKIGSYTPLGAGLQFNLASVTYIFLQANYRISLNKYSADNSLFYSLGVTESISKHKAPKLLPPPPPPVVEIKDRDKDGVVDSLDACPDVAGLASLNGCPDTDGDGIADKDDKCPTIAGLAKYNGCPIPDTDGDGINDEVDKCPTVPGVARYNGCPIPDTDGDGVNDEEDKCPQIAGTKENQGCPEVKQEIIKKVTASAKNVFFATNSAKLLPKSFKGLDAIAAVLTDDKALKLDIEGHTDITGTSAKNQLLSEQRAKAVLSYLQDKKGIDASRLTAIGYGATQPIADNKTAKGRALNRRVVLKLKYF